MSDPVSCERCGGRTYVPDTLSDAQAWLWYYRWLGNHFCVSGHPTPTSAPLDAPAATQTPLRGR